MNNSINDYCPLYETIEYIDSFITRRLRYYNRHFKNTNSIYYAGKVQGLVQFAHLIIDSENVQAAIDKALSIAACSDLLHNDYNLGLSESIEQAISRVNNLGRDMTLISFDDYWADHIEQYKVDYFDNDGDLISFANGFISKQDAIKEIMGSMYCLFNLDESNLFHFSKAMLIHVAGECETIENVHYFTDGIGSLMCEL